MRSLSSFLKRQLLVVGFGALVSAALVAGLLWWLESGFVALLLAALIGGGALALLLTVRALAVFRRSALVPLEQIEASLGALELERAPARTALEFKEIASLHKKVLSLANTLSQRHKAQERTLRTLNEQARGDRLTSLGNAFALSEAIAQEKEGTLALIRLPKVRAISEFYGTCYGDALLLAVGHFLKERFNRRAFRAGGDTFGVLLADKEPLQVCQALLAEIEALGVVHQGISLSSEAVAGLAALQGSDPIAQAQMALKEAIAQQKPVALFDDDNAFLHTHEQNLLWAKKIEAALSEDRIRPYFQPYVDLASGQVVGYEALARLIDEKRTAVTPGFFLPAAQNSGLYPQISERILTRAIEQLAEQSGWICLNLTVEDILHLDIEAILKRAAERGGVALSRIWLELSWDARLLKDSTVGTFLKRVRREGVRLLIENFGTGGEDLSALLMLQPDAVKFSGALLQAVTQKEAALSVTTGLLALMHQAKIAPIATFVTDQASMQRVQALGFVYAQGSHFGDAKEVPA